MLQQRNLTKIPSYLFTTDDLFSQLNFILDNLTNDFFTTLIESMKSRCIAIFKVRGGANKYWVVCKMRVDWTIVIFARYGNCKRSRFMCLYCTTLRVGLPHLRRLSQLYVKCFCD